MKRLACESWKGRRPITAPELGRRMSLARSVSSVELSARMAEPIERRRATTGTYPFLEAAFRTPLRANGRLDGLSIRKSYRRPPRPTKAQSPTTRKQNVGRELHNGSGFSCEPRRFRGRSKPIRSSPDCITSCSSCAVVRPLQALVMRRARIGIRRFAATRPKQDRFRRRIQLSESANTQDSSSLLSPRVALG